MATATPDSRHRPAPRRPLLESVGVLALTLPLALWQSAFWLLVPLAVLYFTRRPFEAYAVRWNLGGLALNLTLVVVILGGYAVGHYLFGRFVQGAEFRPRLPPDLGWLTYRQLLEVALPEEFFFRAYLQTNLNHAWGRPFRLWGADWGWALPMGALVFALCHLFHGDATQLKVVFFGLFAGWLRERTGSIAGPVLYHAAGNILLYAMIVSFS
jgi:membrane protease YdiL (CAAX protease family)